jgi:hypothetical protein
MLTNPQLFIHLRVIPLRKKRRDAGNCCFCPLAKAVRPVRLPPTTTFQNLILEHMKRVGTIGFILFSFISLGVQAQTVRVLPKESKHSIQLPPANSTASARPEVTPASGSGEQPLVVVKREVSYVQDTSDGMWRLIDPLNQLPNTPNQNGDSLELGKSVSQFGTITVNGDSFEDTLYKRVMVLRVNTPDDISSPKIDSVTLTFLPQAFDPRDVLSVWIIPIVDGQTQAGNIYPFPDLFSSSRGTLGAYAQGAIPASKMTIGELNTLTVSYVTPGQIGRPLYVGKKVVPQFGIAVFDDGPGFFNDSLYFQMDFGPEATEVDTDGTINGGAGMRTYYSVLDGGTNYVSGGNAQLITNNASGFLSGFFTADQEGNFLGNLVATSYFHGTLTAGVDQNANSGFTLDDIYPNPISTTAEINYSVGSNSPVVINVYNTLGETVGTVVNGVQHIGSQTATFNASKLANGIYYIKMQAGEFSAMKTMIVSK